MDNDRKYGQRGYQDNGPGDRGPREDRPKFNGPKPPIDVTGPRLPRLVESVTAARCWNCSTTFLDGLDFTSKCPKCNSDLHCCKGCTHFDSSTRFQCVKAIPERIAKKDLANECTFFKTRVTVARDTPTQRPVGGYASTSSAAPPTLEQLSSPKSSQEARVAFDSLFKK